MGNLELLAPVFTLGAPAAPTATSHTFAITSGTPFSQGGWRGYKQLDARGGSESGSIDDAAFTTPDGVGRTLQFIIAMSATSMRIELTDLTPQAQFPDRITLERAGTSMEFGSLTDYADRFGAQADYTAASGNALTLMATGTVTNVTFHWD